MNASNGSIVEEGFELRRGPWTFEEDTILIQYIASHGQGQWNMLAKFSGLRRSGKSCRLRWLNYLKPGIKRGNLTIEEQLLILELHSQFGNRWSKIAQYLPGRTDNEIKNYWRTRVQKQAHHLKVDSNSKRFLQAVKHLCIPRLIEQMNQNTMKTQDPLALSSTFQPKINLDSFDHPYFENQISVSNITPEKISSNYPYDNMECFHLDTMFGADICNCFRSDSQMAGRDWIIDDMASIVNSSMDV